MKKISDSPTDVVDGEFSTRDICDTFGVDRTTIFRWCRQGILNPRRDHRGWRVFSRKDMERAKRLTEAGMRSWCDIELLKKKYQAGLIDD